MSFQTPATAQSLTYDVVKDGKPIGTIFSKLIRHPDGTEQYLIETDVAFRVITQFALRYLYDVKFKNGTLFWCHTQSLLNGKERDRMTTTQQPSHYLAHDGSSGKQLQQSRIAYTTALLYYREPLQVQQVYSERFGEFCKIIPQGKGKYILEMPDGKQNIYHYENGICTRVDVSHFLADFSFVLRQNKDIKTVSK